MSVIVTWKNGTPLGPRSGPHGSAIPATQYAIAGSIANRGAGLATAIEQEIGLGAGTATISGTDVLVNGEAVMTIADGEIDRPTNRRLGAKVIWLISRFGGDPATTALQVLRAIVRVMKMKRGMTKVQVQALVGNLYDAITTNTD